MLSDLLQRSGAGGSVTTQQVSIPADVSRSSFLLSTA